MLRGVRVLPTHANSLSWFLKNQRTGSLYEGKQCLFSSRMVTEMQDLDTSAPWAQSGTPGEDSWESLTYVPWSLGHM